MRLAMITLGLLVSVLGCAESNDGAAAEPAAVDWSLGRGTAACHQWQQGFCEFMQKCGAMPWEGCVAQNQGMACKSDAAASKCAATFSSASCTGIPADCTYDAIRDRAPAVALCEGYAAAACDLELRCGKTSDKTQCVATVKAARHCDVAVSIQLSYETCISELKSMSCASALPTACTQAVLGG